mgnify:CR=1 FL=1
MKYPIIITCILAFIGCSTKSTTNCSNEPTNKALAVLDITKRPEKQIALENIIENIEYIPLETNDSILVDGKPNVVSDRYIIYYNANGQINIFTRKGKSLYSFNRRGGSQEEYSHIHNIILDEEKNELYIQDIFTSKIFVYSIDGKFKRRLVLPRMFIPECLMNYDKDYLFCYNCYFEDKTENMPKENMNQENIKNRDNPYFFISKQTGKVTPFNYTIPNRMGNQAYTIKNGEITMTHEISIFPLAQNTHNIMITEFADDTLYSLKDGKLSPIMIKKPSAHKMNPPMLVGVDIFTDRYIFMMAYKKEFVEEFPIGTCIIYDIKFNNFYRLGTRLPISFPMKGNKTTLPHNTGIVFRSAERILKDYETGKLEGELKEIASKLKEDDNPILMLVKIKE